MNNTFEKIAQYVKEHCQADDYSLNVRSKDSYETRFAQNRVTQHIAGTTLTISLEVAFDAKTGTCTVNQSDPGSLDILIATAEEMAKLNKPDPEFMPSQTQQQIPDVENVDQATRALQPAQLVEIARDAIDRAKAMDANVSGMTERHYLESMLATKNGFFGNDARSEFGHSMTLKKGDVETKVSYDAKALAGFSLDEQFGKLASQAESLKELHSFDPCRIAVILRPTALQELLWFMGWMMNRRQSDEGFTPFTGQLGKQFFGEKFSWYSTLKDDSLLRRKFDGEGVVSQDTAWVEKGVLNNMPVNRHWAKQSGLEPLNIFNVYIPGGESSEEQMLAMVPRGLIINRFWYIRTVDAKVGELTGMTRDGVLYFEDGKVRHAVNNLRFNEIPHVAMRNILALGPSVLASSAMKLPTMLIDGFNFVDKTSF
jgi:predicted Zn-dependent protease